MAKTNKSAAVVAKPSPKAPKTTTPSKATKSTPISKQPAQTTQKQLSEETVDDEEEDEKNEDAMDEDSVESEEEEAEDEDEDEEEEEEEEEEEDLISTSYVPPHPFTAIETSTLTNGLDSRQLNAMKQLQKDMMAKPQKAKSTKKKGKRGYEDEQDQQDDDENEVWVFRMPLNFPINSLNGQTFSISSKSSSPHLSLTPASQQHQQQSYGLFTLDPSQPTEGGEIGELKSVQIIGGDDVNYMKMASAQKVKKHLSIIPLITLPSVSSLAPIGQAIRDQEYVARQHPEDMKAQFEPFGATTDGDALKASLERYEFAKEEKPEAVPASGKKKRRKD